jgi:LysR family hydrogen peroxide-inducible transcriptional activator
MGFHQLRYVCAVADTGTFSRATERCQIAQPSLSHQVLKLEEDFGARLFDRLGRSVRLTEAGRVFIHHARAILDGAPERWRQKRRPSRQHSCGCDSNLSLPI